MPPRVQPVPPPPFAQSDTKGSPVPTIQPRPPLQVPRPPALKAGSPPASKAAPEPPPSDDAAIVSAGMSERFDRLNALWKAAEESLKKLMVPAQVTHEYDKDYDTENSRQSGSDLYDRHYIAWATSKGSWRLCYGFSSDVWEFSDPDYGISFTPLLDAGIEIRQKCVPFFGNLKEKLIARGKTMMTEMDETIAQLAAELKKEGVRNV